MTISSRFSSLQEIVMDCILCDSVIGKLNIWTIDEVQHIFAVIIGAGACTATADIANSTLGYFRGGVRSNAPGSIAPPPVRCPHFIGLDTFAFIVQR